MDAFIHQAGERAFPGSGARYGPVRPILCYGSSTTQGGRAARPGNSDQAIVSRSFTSDDINLRIPGSAKAEPAIVNDMSDLDISELVCDDDRNAPGVDYLLATHAGEATHTGKIAAAVDSAAAAPGL